DHRDEGSLFDADHPATGVLFPRRSTAMFTMMNNARLNVGLQGVQIGEAATRKAVSYALERIQSARAGAADRTPARIADHPDVRRMLMRMSAQTQAARALVYYAAVQVDLAALGDEEAQGRLEILTPLAKAHATDLGNEIASIGVQVHGGMGYVEETGAAQLFRDARITPIYEGTNGIQAADLVGRKLGLSNGKAFEALLTDLRTTAKAAPLTELIYHCEDIGRRLTGANADDRLAASYPFLTMLSVAVCGWLMEQQHSAATDDDFGQVKKATAAFYLDQIVPEAIGLAAAASAPADQLYAIDPALLLA
ncbi:acyl-CoA dehydrogenase, partial [Sphingomonas sp. HHU CXW]